MIEHSEVFYPQALKSQFTQTARGCDIRKVTRRATAITAQVNSWQDSADGAHSGIAQVQDHSLTLPPTKAICWVLCTVEWGPYQGQALNQVLGTSLR